MAVSHNAWQAVWADRRGAFDSGKYSASDQRWREAYQLVMASIMYGAEAVRLMDDAGKGPIHERVHDLPGWTVSTLPQDLPQFATIAPGSDPVRVVGSMHLASASVRLCTVVSLVHQVRTAPLGALFKSSGIEEWDRDGEVFRCLKMAAGQLKGVAASAAGCCQKPLRAGLGKKQDERLRVFMAMIVAHRDEFGHGEEGAGKPGGYRDKRKGLFDSAG